jgi:hypothetical protein
MQHRAAGNGGQACSGLCGLWTLLHVQLRSCPPCPSPPGCTVCPFTAGALLLLLGCTVNPTQRHGPAFNRVQGGCLGRSQAVCVRVCAGFTGVPHAAVSVAMCLPTAVASWCAAECTCVQYLC